MRREITRRVFICFCMSCESFFSLVWSGLSWIVADSVSCVALELKPHQSFIKIQFRNMADKWKEMLSCRRMEVKRLHCFISFNFHLNISTFLYTSTLLVQTQTQFHEGFLEASRSVCDVGYHRSLLVKDTRDRSSITTYSSALFHCVLLWWSSTAVLSKPK